MQIPSEFVTFMRDMERTSMKREAEAAKADPLAHKLTRVFDAGTSTNYHYWQLKTRRNTRVRYCYSIQRNTAGFYLAWRETVKPKQTERDQWASRRMRKAVKDLSLRRYRAHKARLTKKGK